MNDITYTYNPNVRSFDEVVLEIVKDVFGTIDLEFATGLLSDSGYASRFAFAVMDLLKKELK